MFGSWKRSLFEAAVQEPNDFSNSCPWTKNTQIRSDVYFNAFHQNANNSQRNFHKIRIKDSRAQVSRECFIFMSLNLLHNINKNASFYIMDRHFTVRVSVCITTCDQKIPSTQFKRAMERLNGNHGMHRAIFDFVECNVSLHKRWVHNNLCMCNK